MNSRWAWRCSGMPGRWARYHLETTRLQPREKPYNLNVELARFRLMKIVQKQEDWNLFDFPKAEKFIQRFRDSQSLFADALGKLDEPAEAAKLADQSLAIAIDLSEQLAAFHGELLINRRRQTNGFVKHIFGCRVDPVDAEPEIQGDPLAAVSITPCCRCAGSSFSRRSTRSTPTPSMNGSSCWPASECRSSPARSSISPRAKSPIGCTSGNTISTPCASWPTNTCRKWSRAIARPWPSGTSARACTPTASSRSASSRSSS